MRVAGTKVAALSTSVMVSVPLAVSTALVSVRATVAEERTAGIFPMSTAAASLPGALVLPATVRSKSCGLLSPWSPPCAIDKGESCSSIRITLTKLCESLAPPPSRPAAVGSSSAERSPPAPIILASWEVPLFKSCSEASDLSVLSVPSRLASINSSRPDATSNGCPFGRASSRRVPSSVTTCCPSCTSSPTLSGFRLPSASISQAFPCKITTTPRA